MNNTETDRIATLEARIAELEAQLAEREAVLAAVMDNNPDAITLATLEGALTFNAAAAESLGNPEDAGKDEWSQRYGLYKDEGKTAYPVEELPLSRALGGAAALDCPIFSISEKNPGGVWLSVSARPVLRDGVTVGAVAVFRDVTERRRLEAHLAAQNAALAESEQEKSELIDRLRAAVEELSTPVLELWDDVLALPVVGVVDSQRSAEMTERLLAETARAQARYVIVDLTGVEMVDTATADRLLKLVQSVELLGTRCFVTGIQPAVAQTIVDLGIDLGGLRALRNLKHALKLCMRSVVDEGQRL